MDYEQIKNEFIKLKKEELNYIDEVVKLSSSKILSEYEKLEIYRTLKNYEVKLNEKLKILRRVITELARNGEKITKDKKDILIEFKVDENYLSTLKCNYYRHKEDIFEHLGIDIEDFKFKLTLLDLLRNHKYRAINQEEIQNTQKLIENPIYILKWYKDLTEDCYGPCTGDPDDYLYGVYEYFQTGGIKEISKKHMAEFEKNNLIIHSSIYVQYSEASIILEEALLDNENKTIYDCVIQANNRIEELNYLRSPEYKEKCLIEKINELYQKVKGECIQTEILYGGNFLQILRETYRLPDETTVQKEKVVKNAGKDSVIVIAITHEKEYLITFQNRIQDKMIAEFPSGYIENGESVIDAANRELKEETGYASDDLLIVDEVYTSPGIDNSITYIVLANNCTQIDKQNISGSELLSYGLFSEQELNYLVNNNIIRGAMNKLAYYILGSKLDDCDYGNGNKRIYKKLRKKSNPLDFYNR